MSSLATLQMTVAVKLNAMEQEYFFRRCNEEASAKNYIASNTWRAFRSIPKTDGIPSDALRSAFSFLSNRLETFLQKTSNLTRPLFDAFHEIEVEALYNFLNSYRTGIVVQPRAEGSFHGCAYNAYCKVINLAHTHWCFRRRPNKPDVQYPPSKHPDLRHCLHIPLDTKVLAGVGAMVDDGELPGFSIPRGGMGSVRTRGEYVAIQSYLRGEADRVMSTNFRGSTLSPLAFEGFW